MHVTGCFAYGGVTMVRRTHQIYVNYTGEVTLPTCTGLRMGWSSAAVGKRNFIAKDLKSL